LTALALNSVAAIGVDIERSASLDGRELATI
jgi:phosphopantetheinyl transferase